MLDCLTTAFGGCVWQHLGREDHSFEKYYEASPDKGKCSQVHNIRITDEVSNISTGMGCEIANSRRQNKVACQNMLKGNRRYVKIVNAAKSTLVCTLAVTLN